MYNLKLSAEELGTIQSSLITTRSEFQRDPAFYEEEITIISAVLEKLRATKYIAEEEPNHGAEE